MSGLTAWRASGVAGLELLDEFVLDATDEADGAGLALQRRGGTDEERALLLGEDERRHVVGFDDRVDDGEVGVGSGGRCRGDRVTEQEADTDDEVVAVVDEARDALGAVAVTGRGALGCDDAEVGDGLVEAGAGGVVERLVATTGDVVHDADGGVALTGGGVAACGRLASVGAVLSPSLGAGRGAPMPRCGRCSPPVPRCRRVRRWTALSSSSLPQAAEAQCGDDAERKNPLALDHVSPSEMCSGGDSPDVHGDPQSYQAVRARLGATRPRSARSSSPRNLRVCRSPAAAGSYR